MNGISWPNKTKLLIWQFSSAERDMQGRGKNACKHFITARSSYASAVLGIVILSVSLSVCHMRVL